MGIASFSNHTFVEQGLYYFNSGLASTRFVASEEAGCSDMHKRAVIETGWGGTTRTLVITGRPLRVKKNDYVNNWEKMERREELMGLLEKGVRPVERDLEGEEDVEVEIQFLMGEVAAMINDVKPAKDIVEEMIREASRYFTLGGSYMKGLGSKL